MKLNTHLLTSTSYDNVFKKCLQIFRLLSHFSSYFSTVCMVNLSVPCIMIEVYSISVCYYYYYYYYYQSISTVGPTVVVVIVEEQQYYHLLNYYITTIIVQYYHLLQYYTTTIIRLRLCNEVWSMGLRILKTMVKVEPSLLWNRSFIIIFIYSRSRNSSCHSCSIRDHGHHGNQPDSVSVCKRYAEDLEPLQSTDSLSSNNE